MRFPRTIAATALTLALACVCGGCACTRPGRTGPRGSRPRHRLADATWCGPPAATPPLPPPMRRRCPAPPPHRCRAPPCSRACRRSAATAAAVTAAGIPRVFSSVTVTFSEHAQELAAADPRLSPTDVATAVEQRDGGPAAAGTRDAGAAAAITVDDFTSTLASNASVLGFTFRNVMLIGEVIVTGAGRAAPRSTCMRGRVSRAAMPAAGPVRLAPLYSRFAQLVSADLRGVEPPAEQLPR